MGGPAFIGGQRVEHTDNFFEAPVTIDGHEYKTAEHFFQAMKFADDSPGVDAMRASVRAASNGGRAWQIGQARSVPLRSDWEAVKRSVMYQAVKAKYDAYPKLAAELAATQGQIRAAPSTADWQHANSLILERVREELRPEEARNAERLQALVRLTGPPGSTHPIVPKHSNPLGSPLLAELNSLAGTEPQRGM